MARIKFSINCIFDCFKFTFPKVHFFSFKVIVIENGTIAEQGNHKELLSRDGVYRRLVYRQLTTEDDNGENDAARIEHLC